MNLSLLVYISLPAITFLAINGRPYGQTSKRNSHGSHEIWHPESMSADEFIRCKGIPCDQWERIQEKMIILEELQQRQYNPALQKGLVQKNLTHQTLDEAVHNKDLCEIVQEQEIDVMIEEIKKENKSRRPRSIDSDVAYERRKWPLPILYKFNGQHTPAQKSVIYSALSHWEAETCIRFKELEFHEGDRLLEFILFTAGQGCWSYIGKWARPMFPQIINLMAECFHEFGVIVHEIGHTLGLHHHHMRPDRDNHLKVSDYALQSFITQFFKMNTSQMITLGVEYDYGSVMHYPHFNKIIEIPVLFAKDPLYNDMMGQRTKLSFYDTKIINKVYCKDECTRPLQKQCKGGGYQDPNNCSKCKCPDGFSGTYCTKIKHSSDNCSGTLYLSREDQFISTPGHPNFSYKPHTECTWHIKSSSNTQIQFRFLNLSVYRQDNASPCNHWVEIRYKEKLERNGPRFCGQDTPNMTFTSEENEMMVLFRSNMPGTGKGFQAKVKQVSFERNEQKKTRLAAMIKAGDKYVVPDTVLNPTTMLIEENIHATKDTTTATTLKSATDIISKISSNAGNGSEFKCSFELVHNTPSLCGMTQSLEDGTDWITCTGPTLSVLTGPDSAYKGHHYIYIDASGKKSGSKARIETPGVSQPGTFVLTFAYHMYGLYVNKLSVSRYDTVYQNQTFIWKKTGDQSNMWHVAKVQVILEKENKIVFEGVIGDDFKGDIAIDEIILTHISNSMEKENFFRKTFHCSFEQELPDQLCGLTLDSSNQYDWIISKGRTKSKLTGPKTAYDGNWYIYAEASDGKEGDIARLYVPPSTNPGKYTLTFAYSMYGLHIGSLCVYIIQADHNGLIWQKSGNQGTGWTKVYMTINLGQSDQVMFEAVRGHQFAGDIALDKVTLDPN